MKGESVDRWVLRIAGFAGLAIFATFFVFTWAMPRWVEDFGAEYLEREAIERVEAQIDAFEPRSENGLAGALAAELFRRNEQRIVELKTRLKVQARELIPLAIAQARDPGCECRRALDGLKQTDGWQVAQLLADGAGLTAFVQSHYLRIVGELKNEIRIFTGINALSFVLLLAISFAKPAAARHLLIPGLLLLFATVFCAGLYVFSQNWMITIIQGNYVGFAYLAYLGLVFAFMCDIVFNRGRVSTAIYNVTVAALGTAVSSIATC